jgi:tripartite-type tricarboxylate transporter receptor subunit TctC
MLIQRSRLNDAGDVRSIAPSTNEQQETPMRFKQVMALAAAVVVTAAVSPIAVAQDFPTKPINIVVPFPPGGSNDVLARVLGQKMSESFGQPVIVQNKPGAAGNIGTEVVAKSEPDGIREPRAVSQAAL